MTAKSTCSSCGAEITWVLTTAGKRMPLDPRPSPDGNVLIDDNGVATVIKGSTAQQSIAGRGQRLYVSHFATCPNADQHRTRS